MEIFEGGRVAVWRMDITLYTILGDGTRSLLSSLLSGAHIQLNVNRYVQRHVFTIVALCIRPAVAGGCQPGLWMELLVPPTPIDDLYCMQKLYCVR